MSFQETLKKLMEDEGTSNVSLAKAIGVTDTSILRWKRGEAVPSLDNAVAIAKYYGITVNDLVDDNVIAEASRHARIPILGSVSVYDVMSSSLYTGDYLTLGRSELNGYPSEECYALRVRDNTMEPEFHMGFYLIIHQQKQCNVGDYALLMDKNAREVMFKRYDIHGDKIELIAPNPIYKIITYRKQDVNNIVVHGVLINTYMPY